MEFFDALEKYHKIVKEEDKFNYKYNPILNTDNIKRRRISQLFNNSIKIRKLKVFNFNEKDKDKEIIYNKNQKSVKDKKIKDRFINNSFFNMGSVLEEKFFLSQIKMKKSLVQGNMKKIKGYVTKSQCPYCQKELSTKETENDSTNLEKFLTEPNKYFKQIKSYFSSNNNNFPILHPKINTKFFSFKKNYNEEKEDKINLFKNTFSKKADNESPLKKIEKIKLVKREEINTDNLYIIEKPLISSMRGKIYKNMKQRFKRPLRLIILDPKNNNPINHSNNN